MTETQLMDVAKVCNRYPDIQLTYEVVGGTEVAAEDAVTLQVRNGQRKARKRCEM